VLSNVEFRRNINGDGMEKHCLRKKEGERQKKKREG
jgi:hypothetical protein